MTADTAPIADTATVSARARSAPVPQPSRHRLHPATRVLWRGSDSVQLELGDRALVVDGVDTDIVRRLLGLPDAPARPAADRGCTDPARDDERIGLVVDRLTRHGFLWANPPAPAVQPNIRLAQDLAALQVRHGSAAAGMLHTRSTSTVSIRGNGRLAAPIGAVLAAAGVGRVVFHDHGQVRVRDTAVGGLSPCDEGRPFRDAATDAVHLIAPTADTTVLAPGQHVDLVVIAAPQPVEEDLNEYLHLNTHPHLIVGATGDSMSVGPLVLPGLTGCLACGDLHRADRDPMWSALAVQLSVPPKGGAPSDTALATIAAGLCALEALAFLDGDEPASHGASLELHLPDWRLRRRRRPPHEDCDCGAHASSVPVAPV